ncbi:unnamed protein product [Cylindrotheca closterium]|uniref:Uncharacterized protein n=1 Tax=Cylindrotheca closterium TaxID=2856 RepID=A0AAD2G9N0_9STRA|nr:unnamed protein product [Cylindrotheca closterium]
MKFTTIFALLSASMVSAKISRQPKSPNNPKGKYVSELLQGAKPTKNSQLERRLDQNYEVDISQYSVKFQKCQFVKSYDDDLAADEDMPTVLATKRFIVFRLCPDNNCESCSNGYGEYLVDLETYLAATVDYQKGIQQAMCNACQNNCVFDDDQYNNNGDDDGAQRKLENYPYSLNCNTCYEECSKIENMEKNGYRDATDFLECTVIHDPEDDDKTALYAGPMCASSGYKIKIGVFTDQYCSILDADKDVDDYLMSDDGTQSKLSHALLKTVYTDGYCVSCAAYNNGNDDGGQANDMCDELYQESAKCEKAHGFDNGYANYDSDYQNQLAQEEIVCDFIDSIKAGSYDDYGEIVVTGANLSSSGTTTTSGQKLALSFFVFGTIGLAFYAGKLHRELTKGIGPGPGLAEQGGTMA